MKIRSIEVCMVLLLCITTEVSVSELSEKELGEAIMKNDITKYMIQSIQERGSGDEITDIQCNVDDNNTIILDVNVSQRQSYTERRDKIPVNVTTTSRARWAATMAVLSYIDVVAYYPTVGDLIINTNANKTFTCHRNRVNLLGDRSKLATQIAYST